MKKILVIGSANMDLSLNVYRVPDKGETVVDNGGVAYTPGGKGANAAAAFAKLGADVTLCTKLGQDTHGQQLYTYYKSLGLDTSAIRVDRDLPTGFATVIKEADGENRIICYPGANAQISGEHMMDAFDKSNPDALFVGFEISFDSALTAARIAEVKGVPIFVDAAPASKKYSLEALPYMEIFSPNEAETFEYTGIMPSGQDSSLRAALALWRRVRCKYLVIKQGARGCSIYDGKHFDMIPAERVENVVDTTAAGDTFTAALTLAYLSSGDIKAAAKYASYAAAITVSREGATGSVPTAEEVKDFIISRS